MIIAAIQVRMGSTRLPSKVLADVCGRPMLAHLVRRAGAARRVDQVVIATSTEPADAPIRKYAEQHGIPCYAGSLSDLIDRLYQTARTFNADQVVWLTGDNPLVDPELIDAAVEAYEKSVGEVDYVTMAMPPTYPTGLGVELYPALLLEHLWRDIRDPFYREWFPTYVEEHPRLRYKNVANDTDLSSLRWTVDYEEDLHFVREVFRRLDRDDRVFGWREVLELVCLDPAVGRINEARVGTDGLAIARQEQSQRKSGGKE